MAGIAAALFGAVASVIAQNSPVGDWDFVLSGSQKGVAQITFNSDFTLSGTEVITARPDPAPDENERGGPDPASRHPLPGEGTTNTFFFGSSPLVGTWTFNGSGVVGILIEGDVGLTNGISFKGKRSGNRLTLVGHHEGRTINYRGVPLTAASNIMGNFSVMGKKDGEAFVELMNLTPDITQNRYLVTGQGPAYDFTGFALLSVQNQLAIASLQSIGTNGVLSAVSGSFNPRSGRGSLSGVAENARRVTGKVSKQ